jgi:hypothetical protein
MASLPKTSAEFADTYKSDLKIQLSIERRRFYTLSICQVAKAALRKRRASSALHRHKRRCICFNAGDVVKRP